MIKTIDPAMRTLIAFFLCLFCFPTIQAQSDYWKTARASDVNLSLEEHREFLPNHYSLHALDLQAMKAVLETAPMEFTDAARKQPLTVQLPMPDGQLEAFKIFEAPVMEPGISARYSFIKSFKGQSTQHPENIVRLDISKTGFHAAVKTKQGKVYIDNYMQAKCYPKNPQDVYMSYFTKDYPSGLDLKCGTEDADEENPLHNLDLDFVNNRNQNANDPVDMKVYRLALACVGEWGQNHGGGTIESVLSIMNTAVNRLNMIFEIEMGFRLVLIDNNDQCIMLNPNTDPYSMVNLGGFVLAQSTNIMNGFVSHTEYDIGHVFTTGCTGGLAGIANLGVVCGANKAAGVSCLGAANVESFMVSTTAHEIGHQFNVTHTFNYCDGENESAGTAFEPGSGSTIMSYAGACGTNNVASTNDDYFHVGSLEQMYSFIFNQAGGSCPEYLATGNHNPSASIDLEGGFYIPRGTPFELTGTASDEDGDALTYCWEQYDVGPLSPLGSPITTAPLFRSYPPTAESPTRVFPRLSKIIENNFDNKEVLPGITRPLTFRFTVRDNNPEAGGAAWAEIEFNSTIDAGPFFIISPNTDVTWTAGSNQEVTWDVSDTDLPPVNCQLVNIKLSLDGGYTYPVMLAENVVNDGSHEIVVPDMPGTENRIRVEAADNIFFDISNQDFIITEANEATFNFEVAPYTQRICLPQIAPIDINSMAFLGFSDPVTLSVNGLPDGAVASFDNNTLTPGESTVMHVDMTNSTTEGNYTIEITGTANDTIVQTHEVLMELVSNDFSSLALSSPSNGTSNVTGQIVFDWEPSPDANTYDIEIATSPAFGNSVVDANYGTDLTTYTSTYFFDENTLHYWRVRPNNECGSGAFTAPFGFHTPNTACNAVENNNTLNIPASLPTNNFVESQIVINESYIIEDLNVCKIEGFNNLVKHIKATLISPAGTQVVLFENLCGNHTEFNLGFDDESPTLVDCPPNTGLIYNPQEALSAFDGEDIQGVWRMRITEINNFSSGGQLQSWCIETCGQIFSSPPSIVTNEPFPVNPGDSRIITKDFLKAQNPNVPIALLTFTVVTDVEHGTLYFNNTPLSAGSEFGQGAINDFRISYQHNGDDSLEDQFTFTVRNNEGGWVGTPAFQIVIDEDAVYTGTTETELAEKVTLYPNPANTFLNIDFEQPLSGEVQINVYDVSGKTLLQKTFPNNLQTEILKTDQLTNGLYFIEFKNNNQVFSKKFSIQR